MWTLAQPRTAPRGCRIGWAGGCGSVVAGRAVPRAPEWVKSRTPRRNRWPGTARRGRGGGCPPAAAGVRYRALLKQPSRRTEDGYPPPRPRPTDPPIQGRGELRKTPAPTEPAGTHPRLKGETVLTTM